MTGASPHTGAGARRSVWTGRAAFALVLLLYGSALVLWRDQVPEGLHNDTVEEVQRGIYLVEGRHLEAITTAIGNSAETLYLYLVGGAVHLLGPSTLAIQIVSWIFALACIWLGVALVRRLDASIPLWAVLLLFVSSVWLFHYARSGLRTISAPVFLLAFCLLLDRAERSASRAAAVGAGAVLGLSLYAYTACRLLLLALAVHFTVRLLRGRAVRRKLLVCYAWMTGGALLISIPNLLFLADSPRDFLLRGGYVVRGGPRDWAEHLLWTFLLPFHYPDVYRLAVGPAHFIDGVSTSFKAAGLNPISPIVAVAFVAGLVIAWRRRREPVPMFLLSTWFTGNLLLGFMGPSLTRLLILLPVYLVFAALGIGAALRWGPRLGPLVALVLSFVVATGAYDYFVTFKRSQPAQYVFSQAATAIGERAAVLAAEGKRVVAVVSKDFNTVRYLTHGHESSVRIVEYYRRPLDPRQLAIEEFQPHLLLLERHRRFAPFGALFPPERRVDTHPAFDEIRLDRLER